MRFSRSDKEEVVEKIASVQMRNRGWVCSGKLPQPAPAYTWEIQLRNSLEKYAWEMQLRNTIGKYSWPSLVWPYTEEPFSRPFVGENQFWLVLQNHISTENAVGCLFFHQEQLFFCPTHAHCFRCSVGISNGFVMKQVTWICFSVLTWFWSTNRNWFSPTNSRENGSSVYGQTRLGQL